jgi:hypothetical protein
MIDFVFLTHNIDEIGKSLINTKSDRFGCAKPSFHNTLFVTKVDLP